MRNAESKNLGVSPHILTNRQQVPGCSPCPHAFSPSWVPAQANSSKQGTAPEPSPAVSGQKKGGRGTAGEIHLPYTKSEGNRVFSAGQGQLTIPVTAGLWNS